MTQSHHVQLLNGPSGADFPGISFRQAKHFRLGRRGYEACFLVVHCAECAETFTAAEALQAYCATMQDKTPSGKPLLKSWHFAVDADSTTQSVRVKDAAFHCPPLNDMSVGIEMAGWARQLEGDWADPYSRRMLEQQMAPLMARLSRLLAIPLRSLDDAALRLALDTCNMLTAQKATGEEWDAFRQQSCGVVTHAQVSRVFRKSDHHDPGPRFPLEELLERARLAYSAATGA